MNSKERPGSRKILSMSNLPSFDPEILTKDEMLEFLKKFYGEDFSEPDPVQLRKSTSQNLDIFLSAIVQNGQIVPDKLQKYHNYLTVPIQDGIFAAIYRDSPKRNVTKPIRLTLLLSLENDSLINMISELMIVQIQGYEFILPQTQTEFEFFRKRFIRILHWLGLLKWNLQPSITTKVWEFKIYQGYQPDDQKRDREYQRKLVQKSLSLTDEIIYSESRWELMSRQFLTKFSEKPKLGDIISSQAGVSEVCGNVIPISEARFFYTDSGLRDVTNLKLISSNQDLSQIPFEMSFPTFPFGYWLASVGPAFRIEIEKFTDELISNLRGPISLTARTEFRTFFRWEGERVNLAIAVNNRSEAIVQLKIKTGRGYLREDHYFEIWVS